MRCDAAGNGVIVHHSDKLGLVVTDRNTASVSVGDVRMSFGAHPAEVEGRIRFLHPLHNFAILSYNPADLPPEVRVLALLCPRVPRACHGSVWHACTLLTAPAYKVFMAEDCSKLCCVCAGTQRRCAHCHERLSNEGR